MSGMRREGKKFEGVGRQNAEGRGQPKGRTQRAEGSQKAERRRQNAELARVNGREYLK